MNIKNLRLYLLLLIILLIGCSERERNNIFDPRGGSDTLDIRLRPTRADSVIRFFWSSPSDVRFQHYNLYRKAGNASVFQKHAAIPPSQTTFEEGLNELERTYQYFLTLQGEDGESPPTPVLRLVPSLSQIWIIDQANYQVVKLSFGLQHAFLQYNTLWQPQDVSFSKQHQLGLAAEPAYRYLELFRTDSNGFFAENAKIRRPYDSLYDPHNHFFWVSDSIGAVYKIRPADGIENLINSTFKRPVQLELRPPQGVWVLDRVDNSIVALNHAGAIDQTIEAKQQPWKAPVFFQYQPSNGLLYIVNEGSDGDQLLSHNPETGMNNELWDANNIRLVRFSSFDQTLWLAINTDSGAKLLQLSARGQRLSELENFSHITDFRINANNGNIIVCDVGQNKVLHFRPDLTLLGENSELGYPFKVYIE